jgi:Fe-S cluster assembly iron-binding protein IscA
MLMITENAKDALIQLRNSAEIDQPEVGLRLASGDAGRLELVVDRPKEGDQVLEHDGCKVLIVGEEVSSSFDGGTLDCRPGPEGLRLVIRIETTDDDNQGNAGDDV